MYAQKFSVDVVIRGNKKPCPLDWLDQFCMRNFTNSADFDDTLPVADGRLQARYLLTPPNLSSPPSPTLESPAIISSSLLLPHSPAPASSKNHPTHTHAPPAQ